MASRIKGITIEIGGDTTGLDKALKSVNSSITHTQSALKDVNKLLKLDPSNTELLSQKQKLLQEAISSTKEKLDGLKQAQVQAKEQLEKYGIYQAAYTKEEKVNAKKAAKAMLESVAKEASVSAIGDVRAKAGYSIKIQDKATGLSGKFYITSDSHTFEGGTHTMTLSLAWKNEMEPVN